MRGLLLSTIVVALATSVGSAQSNRIVFGPLEGDDAGVIELRGGDEVEIEMWVRTDPDNPAPVYGVSHALMSDDAVISERNGVVIDPDYYPPNWEQVFLDGPFVHNPDDNFPIPEGHTVEIEVGLYFVFGQPQGDPLDTQGEWDYYGSFLMVTNPSVPGGDTYYPYSEGWYPHSNQGTSWAFQTPPGGEVEPEQDYCGLSFPPLINKVVYGPLVGDDAGVLTVLNDQDIEIEIWVQTDPYNPAPVTGIYHGLMSDDAIIAARNGVDLEPEYDMPNWEEVRVDGPYTNNPEDNFPIPEGFTVEMQVGLYTVVNPPVGDPLDTQGDWALYGSFLMTTNSGVPIEDTYYPFSMGWYPETNEGTRWLFEDPPGGEIIPEQGYGGLYFTVEGCEYIPGDCDHNGVPLELVDVLAMIGYYRGYIPPVYECACPPHGLDYAAVADPDGSCVPFELNDAVLMISAYRGLAEPAGCPDCPGTPGLAPGDNGDLKTVPMPQTGGMGVGE
jgi:hypothetical protein